MYDPVIGRFISADPFIQSPDFTQSLNRYAYCINNPLSLIDPSGYSWFSRNWKSITASIVGIAVSVITAGTASGIGIAIIAGAVGGAAGALTGALLNGANIGQIAKNTFIGALVGGASGFLNFASGGGSILEQLFKHTFSQGWLEGIQGGNIFHGFMMGAASSVGSRFVNSENLSDIKKIIANSILSGVIDEIGGGKFANGAITGAFSMLFNDLSHSLGTRRSKEIYNEYLIGSFDDNKWIDALSLAKKIGGDVETELTKWVTAGHDLNGCALRLSMALNNAGYKIPAIKNKTLRGANGMNYIVNAEIMFSYLSKVYPSNIVSYSHHKNVNYGQPFIPKRYFSNASGHIDVVYNSKWASTGGYGYYNQQNNRDFSAYVIQ